MHRRTPCVGICSTTYGDLVCRGCKRFAHEVVGWNGFDDTQRGAVWERLGELLDGSVGKFVEVTNRELLNERAAQLRVAQADALSDQRLAFEVLQRSVADATDLERVGLRPLTADCGNARELVRGIDHEFHNRSLAHYERNYRIAAQ